jgi:hypothetical protein
MDPELLPLLSAILSELQTIRTALTTARFSQPAPVKTTPTDKTVISIDSISKGVDDKTSKTVYKARGGRWQSYGVRVWPEVLPQLGIDPDKLDFGPNPIVPPITVQVELTESGAPRKVIGLA